MSSPIMTPLPDTAAPKQTLLTEPLIWVGPVRTVWTRKPAARPNDAPASTRTLWSADDDLIS